MCKSLLTRSVGIVWFSDISNCRPDILHGGKEGDSLHAPGWCLWNALQWVPFTKKKMHWCPCLRPLSFQNILCFHENWLFHTHAIHFSGSVFVFSGCSGGVWDFKVIDRWFLMSLSCWLSFIDKSITSGQYPDVSPQLVYLFFFVSLSLTESKTRLMTGGN